MTFLTKVGSFSSPTATGTYTVTGLGFTPVAVIFWANVSNATTGWVATADLAIGFAANNTTKSAMQYGTINAWGLNGRTSANKTNENMQSALSALMVMTGCVLSTCAFSSGQFIATFSTHATSYTINYLAIGGTDVTNAGVIQWDGPASTGSKQVTGLGFKPDLVINLYQDNTDAPANWWSGSIFGIGAMDKSGNQWASTVAGAGVITTTSAGRLQVTDSCLAVFAPQYAILERAAFTSMDTDGFTVNYGTNSDGGCAVLSLCLKGGAYQVGNFAKSTAGAPTTNAVTTTGMTPAAVMSFTDSKTAAAGILSGFRYMIGASDGTNHRISGANEKDQVVLGSTTPTTVEYTYESITTSLAVADNDTQATEATGTLGTFASGSFTASWATNTAVATQVCYIAMGATAVTEVDCTVAMTYPGTTYDDQAVTPSIQQNRTVAMTYPGATVDDYVIGAAVTQSNPTVAMPYPGTTYDDYVIAASVEQDRTVAMPYPDTTYDDVAVTASIEQDRSVGMTYPGATYDDYAMAAAIEQDRTVSMTYPNTTYDDYAVVASYTANPTVTMTYPGTTFDDVAVTPSIEQDRSVGMTYPSTTYDDQPVVPSIEQDRSVDMAYPGATYDDQAVVASIEQDRAVSMPYPGSTYDDYAITAAIQQDRSVAMPYPDVLVDDYAVVASYTANPTVAMPYPDTTYDDVAVVAAIQQDRTVSMPYPDTLYDDQIVVPSITPGEQDCTVAMTCPGTVYDDYSVVASITQDRSIAMPYPTTQFDDYAVLPTVTQDRTVGMTSPSTTYDDSTTVASIRQDRTVSMSCPDVAVAAQSVVPSITQSRDIAMSCPSAGYEAYAMTAEVQQDRSVYMPYPDAVLDDAPFDSVIAGHDCYVAMSYPSAEYDDAEAEVSVMQNRAVAMSYPSTAYDDAEILAEVTESSPTVEMTYPGTTFDDVAVTVFILDVSTVIHVQGTLDSVARLDGSLDSIHLDGCFGIIARVEGALGVTAHLEGSIAMLEEQWIKDPPIRRGIYMAIEAPIWTDSSKTTLYQSLSSGTVVWRLIGDFDKDLLVKTSDDPAEIAVDTPSKGYITVYIKDDETLDLSPGIFDHEAVIIITDQAEGLFKGQAVVE